MPAILQMLQNKTFGVHSLPEGWLIVAAGNPPRYNQSTSTWRRSTACAASSSSRVLPPGSHRCRQRRASGRAELSAAAPGALFLLCSASAAAGEFATTRGWEELSALLLAYEALGYPCTLAQMQQYLHAQGGGCRFCRVLRAVPALCRAASARRNSDRHRVGRRRELPFDGRLSVVEFLLHSLQTKSAAMQQDADLAFSASSFGQRPPGADALARARQELLQKRRAALAVGKDCGALPPEEERREAAFLPRAEAALRARRDRCGSVGRPAEARGGRGSPRRRAAKRPAAMRKTACGSSRGRSARIRSSGSLLLPAAHPRRRSPAESLPPSCAPVSTQRR